MMNLFNPADLQIDPIERAETIPSSWYHQPEIFEAERNGLFTDSWHYFGHVSRLSEAGAYCVETIAGDPIIVVRNRENELRAFYNVCRHRGGPLATEECGRLHMLRCQYHGWTYRMDGSLRGVPRFDRSELFDKRDYGLLPVEIAEWEGLLFVRLRNRTGSPSLQEITDGISERIAPIDLSAMSFYRRIVYDVRCNWKIYVDNYLEGYHIPLVHPELCRTLDYRSYVTELFPHYSLQHSPFRNDANDNVYGIADGQAFYYFLFPNMMLNILPGRLQINSVLPVAPDQCSVIFDYYYSDPVGEERIGQIEEDIRFSEVVQQEDIDICEHVQRGVASRAYDRGRFSPETEQGVWHFQTLLKEAFGREREGKNE